MDALFIRKCLAELQDENDDFGFAEVDVGGFALIVEDLFNGKWSVPGKVVSLELKPDYAGISENWEEIFTGNPMGKKEFVLTSAHSYRVFGEVVSIEPVVVSCGVVELQAPVHTSDSAVVGEFIAFNVHSIAAHGGA